MSSSLPPRPVALTLTGLAALALTAWWWHDSSSSSAPVARISSTPHSPHSPPSLKQAALPSLSVATPAVSADDAPLHPTAAAMNLIGSQWQNPAQPEFAAFAGWTSLYLAAPPDRKNQLLAQGVAAATARRAVLARLIRTAPEQALAAAVPVMIRRDLPAEITALLEDRVSGSGSIEMLAGTPARGENAPAIPAARHALVGRQEYEAFAYGRRARLNYLPDVSIVGIALDGALAVSDSPIRVLETGESAAGRPVEEVCVISGQTTAVATDQPLNTAAKTAVETRGLIQMVCQPSHLATLEARLIGGEGLQADGAPGSSGVSGRPAYAWTHGAKKVLVIRVDFSDVPGTPVNDPGTGNTDTITPANALSTFTAAGGVQAFYTQCSYGQTSLSLAATDITAVLRMPSTASSYVTTGAAGTGNAQLLHSDAEAKATAAGFNLDSYDRIVVAYSYLGSLPGSRMTFAGLGSTPGKSVWISGYYDLPVLAHELGHSYGMNHASSWQVTDGNPVSPAGSKVEYGDTTDVMGDGHLITDQFSHWNRSIVQWLPDAAVTTISSSGSYRVHRFDSPSANLANPLALKIVRNRTQDYWIGYRRATANANYNNGAYIVWGANENANGLLLDFNTPGDSVDDAPLAVGQTFNDTAAGISLTTTARGGSGADEYLDVQATFQPRIAWTRSTYTADEQSGLANLTLSRSSSATGAVSAHWATTPGTATSPADFTASSGTVTWANGDITDKIITIPLTPDTLAEGTENFTVTLGAVTGGILVDAPAATVSIVDPGVVDPDFTAAFISSSVSKVLVQPDGNLLIGGHFSSLFDASSYAHAGIARMTATGGIDTSFGTAGGGSAGSSVTDMARQPDGKIVLAGTFTTMNGVARNRIARLNADGSLDPSFDPGAGVNALIRALVLQPDGKVLIGGDFTAVSGSPREYLARLNPNGSLDTTFTGPDFGGSSGGWRISSLALQADGMLLAGGAFYLPGGSTYPAGICRITTSGALDPAFNGVTTGSTVDGDTGSVRSVDAIAVQSDGKILIAGDFTAFNETARGGIARLTATGSLDAAFHPTTDGSAKTLLIQPDGKIVIGGEFTTVNDSDANNLVRLTAAGAVDSLFSAAGGPSATVNSLAMQADGRIVIADEYATLQAEAASPLSRIVSGLSALPGTLQFASATASAAEGSSATLSVTRTGGSGGALSVNYATVPGTAGAADFTATSGTLSWANGDTAAKTITIPLTADALTESTETFTVNLGQPLLGGALLGATQAATVSITTPGSATAYQTWRTSKFTSTELADASISGDNADPDHDGIPNLLEFALNLAPKTAGVTGLPTAALQNIGGSNYLTLTFRRQLAAPELTYAAQTNDTLPGAWTSGAAVLVGTPAANSDGTETVTYRDSVPQTPAAPRRFMRLQVTLAP